MKEKLILFMFFLLSVFLLLTAAAGYSLLSVFMIKRLDPEPYFLAIPAATVTAVSLGVYLLFENIAARYLSVTRLFFAVTTLFLPIILFAAGLILSNISPLPAALLSGGVTLSLTLMLLLLLRYLIWGEKVQK